MMDRTRQNPVIALLCLSLAGCGGIEPPAADAPPAIDACRIVLLPQPGTTDVERKIGQLQLLAQRGSRDAAYLERLGWAFVAKARTGFDSGYLALAEQAALCIDTRHPGSLDALLLHGHVLHQQHRFAETEPIARRLATERGRWFDHALLGDVLLERGDIDAAALEYQRMMDLRPGLPAYVRGAQLRWLTGDVDGALELMQLAVRAADPADPEAAAWALTRLAQLEWQRGAASASERAVDAALSLRPGYAPALLLRGRMLLQGGQYAAAAVVLTEAAGANPLPEYRWTLAEALEADGQSERARQVAEALVATAAGEDPRTLSLYLATLRTDPAQAVALAFAELAARQDVMSLDAMAWALASDGQLERAVEFSERALAAGTRDARLCYHAAAIAHAVDDRAGARRHLECAQSLAHMLLPSERRDLNRIVAALAGDDRPTGSDKTS